MAIRRYMNKINAMNIVITNGMGNQTRVFCTDGSGNPDRLNINISKFQELKSPYEQSTYGLSSQEDFYALHPGNGIDQVYLKDNKGQTVYSFLIANISNKDDIMRNGFMIAHTAYIYVSVE